MRTSVNKSFEFQSQRKVKAPTVGSPPMQGCCREVERGTGLIAGPECFRAERIYGLCLGYEDLNDHDQLRTAPVNKADFQKGAGGHAEQLTGAEVDEQERYKKIAGPGPDRLDGGCLRGGPRLGARGDRAGSGCDRRPDPWPRFFHGYYRPTVISRCRGRSAVRRLRCSNIDGAAGGWNGSSAGLAGRRSRSSSGPTRAFAGMTCSAGVKTITTDGVGQQ